MSIAAITNLVRLALRYRKTTMALMPAILLKNVPPGLHRRLKLRAAAERRSLQQEAMLVLEHGLSVLDAFPHNNLPPPAPMKTEFRMTNAFLEEMKRERDARR